MARYSINFSEDLEKKLEELSGKSDSSKASTIRNALYTYFLLKNEVKQGNNQVAIVDMENRVLKLIILPQ